MCFLMILSNIALISLLDDFFQEFVECCSSSKLCYKLVFLPQYIAQGASKEAKWNNEQAVTFDNLTPVIARCVL